MKHQTYFLSLLLLWGCGNSSESDSNALPNSEPAEKNLMDETPFQPLVYRETYPFSEAQKITIISYPIRVIWDTLVVEGESEVNLSLIENGRIRLPKSRIIDQVNLTEIQNGELFEALYNTPCTEILEMSCWDPRHAFIFYDEYDKAFASIEICLDCLGSMESEGCPAINWCFEKESAMTSFLESVGITYFGGGPEEEGF